FAPSVAAVADAAPRGRKGLAKLGFDAAEITPAMAERLGLRETRGVAITDVDPTSAAARAGVRPGMIVESIDGEEIASRDDLESVVRDLEEGKVASMIVRLPTEGGETRTVLNFR